MAMAAMLLLALLVQELVMVAKMSGTAAKVEAMPALRCSHCTYTGQGPCCKATMSVHRSHKVHIECWSLAIRPLGSTQQYKSSMRHKDWFFCQSLPPGSKLSHGFSGK